MICQTQIGTRGTGGDANWKTEEWWIYGVLKLINSIVQLKLLIEMLFLILSVVVYIMTRNDIFVIKVVK